MSTQALLQSGALKTPLGSLLLRALRIGLGVFWAAGMLLAGLWLWDQPGAFGQMLGALLGLKAAVVEAMIRGLATVLIAGAQFVFLTLAADELCPGAPMVMVVFLKTLTGAITWGAVGLVGWQMWRLGVL